MNNFLKKGKEVELHFANECLKSFKESTVQEDMLQHWDIMDTNTNIKYDIKGLKKNKRRDSNCDESIHWVELTNVNGDPGWVRGKADYIIFETNNEWVEVDRKILKTFITEKVLNVDRKIYSEISLYKLYNRKGRKDVVTKVLTEDLKKISEKIIKKLDTN